ncbi:phosphatidylinositol-glycan biosynthesis class X protein isoform X2 [Phyllopteryx taeniolatus]|uniref:phosphatidylinositol-glycan biosynthesis class X protein isoform X2 n=1 Tax=Phyllopteryx taeniolatus TaxID=161469 RepID=UPI002AD49AE2|nr:phosphatidylinositol-glycan biosynthesis class X protein isoform X2 [Phyllopteryx taeniolatus]
MHFTLFNPSIFTFLLTCYLTVRGDDTCGALKQWLQSTAVSLEIKNNGFHREVETTVELQPGAFRDVRLLLLHRWPSGVYVDPYQLAFLSDAVDWQILVDSTIDLEVPAHKTSGFLTYVYPAFGEQTPGMLKVSIPIHGRYHQPSFVGETLQSIAIRPPQLLLRTEKCSQLDDLEPHTATEAPCTADNTSMCLWIQVQQKQRPADETLRLPVGDGSLVMPVCGMTLAVTMICCLVLSKYMWKHQIV